MTRFLEIPDLKWLLYICLIVLAGCSVSQLPTITDQSATSGEWTIDKCKEPYSQNPVQLIHSLEVALPGDRISNVIGITNIYPGSRGLEIAILSVEGMVLFQASYQKGKSTVLKTSGPFSSDGFVEGLLQDIQLIFLVPDGTLALSGRDEKGVPTCRYKLNNSDWIDVSVFAKTQWTISRYDVKKRLVRSVKTLEPSATTSTNNVFPERIVLIGYGLVDYSITMKLLQVNNI